jgi:hypothetical protein
MRTQSLPTRDQVRLLCPGLSKMTRDRCKSRGCPHRPPALLVELPNAPLRLLKVIAGPRQLPPHERAPPVRHNSVKDVLLSDPKTAQLLQREVDTAAPSTADG